MRIRTEGNEPRQRLIDNAAELWDCNKTDALLTSARFAMAMLGHPAIDTRPGALSDALSHPDMTESLSDELTTSYARLDYRIESELVIDK